MVHPIAILKPRSLSHLYTHVRALVSGHLWLKVVIGMLCGVLVGYLFNPSTALVSAELAQTVGSWVALPGKIFLTIVQMIVVPLVFASVIRGIAANSSVSQLKSTGLTLVFYILATTALSVFIGISIALFVQPGSYVDISSFSSGATAATIESEIESEIESSVHLRDIPQAIVGILPNNPFSDAVEANMLQIVLFSIIVGLALITMSPENAKPLLDLLGSVLEVSMTIVRWIMQLAPYAVFGLIAQLVIQTGFEVFIGIGVFVGCVLFGLAVLLLIYLMIAFAFGGFTPFTFLVRVREALLLAFSTDSSAATMPLSLKTVEEKLKVRPSIAQLVIPIGATINMNATALFQGLTTIFFIQAYGIELSFGVMAVLILTIIGSSIGAPATPGVGIVVLSVVLSGVGVPLEGLALIIGVDQILSRFRAMLNVAGDLTASIVMERLSSDEQTYEEAVHEERALERERRETGDDVLLKAV